MGLSIWVCGLSDSFLFGCHFLGPVLHSDILKRQSDLVWISTLKCKEVGELVEQLIIHCPVVRSFSLF